MTQTDTGATWRVFDAVEIDTAGRRLFVNAVAVPLEPKAFDALLLLVERAGRVCTREELLDAVWGHRHITPSVLSRIITLLRHALGEHGDEPRYLHTVHGLGYRFDAEVRVVSRPQLRETDRSVETEAPGLDLRQVSGNTSVAASTPSNLPYEDIDAANFTPPRKPPRVALLLLPLLAVIAIVSWKLWPQTQPATATDAASAVERRSVAVLPLVNAGGDEQTFLSEGLSETLITTLSQFEGLKVVGRSSSFRFRDSKEDAQSIGAKLGVSHLIEGGVQRAGDDVRVGIRLVRAADGSTVWTQRFDRPYQDLFALQDEIALAVAGALQVRLLHRMPGAVETGRPASGNLEAYAAYLRGTNYMGSVGSGDPVKAIEQFTLATRLDPNYAQAWSWLGFLRTQHARGSLSGEAARAAYAQAHSEIETALKLAPDFGQAHSTLANLLSTADYDWNGALAEFHKALPLVPDTDPSHGAISRLLATLGRINESIAERRKYIDGDPLAAFARVYLAQLLASLGRLDEAEASLRDAGALQPEILEWCASERSHLAILRGDANAARMEAERMPPSHWRDRALALALQIGADHTAADAALQRLIHTGDEGKGDAYAVARVHALRGDADQTFEWLQRDLERHGESVYRVLADPLLLRFRDDPRFAEFCKKTGLPAPSESEALGIDRIREMNVVKR